MHMDNTAFVAPALLTWHARHGRHDLPWQRDPTPYRVWVSEIMLQQTQVATAIHYYDRFMQRFPDVATLAVAPLDEVLHLWSGLGYYSRARNLHRAAQLLVSRYGGNLPGTAAELAELPGIGRSTAAAIRALSAGERGAILDGNVRRVLARCFLVTGALTPRGAEERLWQLAEQCTPPADVAAYTQAIMDLGATICVRRRPLCVACPLESHCAARRTRRQHEIPAPRTRMARRTRAVVMLLAQRGDGSVLLERRPERGVWGGLWCPPQFPSVEAAQLYAATRLLSAVIEPRALAIVRHAFTHFELEITPLMARCEAWAGVMDEPPTLWYNPAHPERLGLPAPVTALIQSIT
ncbi:MAG TPA: A/G-specific adenine glycosylase [Steroidobacteraceae bacterium]|nr:A/G-specific adenine glycosylase [Steroidobacteraceae bacterium]